MQTETMVSARQSAHPGHSAADEFSREFDLADLLAIAPAATPQAAPMKVVPAAVQLLSLNPSPYRSPARRLYGVPEI